MIMIMMIMIVLMMIMMNIKDNYLCPWQHARHATHAVDTGGDAVAGGLHGEDLRLGLDVIVQLAGELVHSVRQATELLHQDLLILAH